MLIGKKKKNLSKGGIYSSLEVLYEVYGGDGGSGMQRRVGHGTHTTQQPQPTITTTTTKFEQNSKKKCFFSMMKSPQKYYQKSKERDPPYTKFCSSKFPKILWKLIKIKWKTL